MSFNYLLYFLLKLVREGHRWQSTDLNYKQSKSRLFFSPLQIFAIVVAGLFVYYKPDGFSQTAIEYIISSLSILTGLYLSLIIFINEKFKGIDWNSLGGSAKIHKWCFYSQFNALTSYSILIAIFVIVSLFLSMIFDSKVDLSDYALSNSLSVSSCLLFIKLSFVVIFRFLLVYFIIDFFILCIYEVVGLFNNTQDDMSQFNPGKSLIRSISITSELKDEFGCLYYIVIVGIFLLLISGIVCLTYDTFIL